jgi:hypothetical protein
MQSVRMAFVLSTVFGAQIVANRDTLWSRPASFRALQQLA